ncbi:hypothetical protein CBL_04899 [Carabus blaptoides fortunei]
MLTTVGVWLQCLLTDRERRAIGGVVLTLKGSCLTSEPHQSDKSEEGNLNWTKRNRTPRFPLMVTEFLVVACFPLSPIRLFHLNRGRTQTRTREVFHCSELTRPDTDPTTTNSQRQSVKGMSGAHASEKKETDHHHTLLWCLRCFGRENLETYGMPY